MLMSRKLPSTSSRLSSGLLQQGSMMCGSGAALAPVNFYQAMQVQQEGVRQLLLRGFLQL